MTFLHQIHAASLKIHSKSGWLPQNPAFLFKESGWLPQNPAFFIQRIRLVASASLKIHSKSGWLPQLPSKFTPNQAGCLSFPQNSLQIRLLSSNSWPSVKFP
jgi:hypothetical protein